MQRWVGVGLALGWLALASGVQAQVPVERCRHATASPDATVAGQDITVGAQVGTVITPNTAYCGGLLTNTSTVDAIRCRQASEADPDGDTGLLILPYQVFSMNQDIQLGLKCIRATNATNDVLITVYVYTE